MRKVADQKRPVRFVASRLLWHSRLSSLLTIRRDRYRLRFYPTAYSATLWLDAQEGIRDEAVFKRFLRPGDIAVDVGANIGSLTLTAASVVGNSGRVFAVEAHPLIYKYLTGNVRLNRLANVETFNVACGHETGVVNFSNQRSDDQNSVSAEGISVPMRRLDDLVSLRQGMKIALLKIDVEGYEKRVLEGATGLLARTDVVYFESWKNHFDKYAYELRDIVELLNKFGFQIYRKSGERVDEKYSSPECENLLASRSDEGVESILDAPE
jgi:FkbM family methyltransferase